MHRIIQLLLLILLTNGGFGQTIITGRLRDYHTKEILSFVEINADTIPFNRQKFNLVSPDTTQTNSDGSFIIRLNNSEQVNLTFSFINYATLTIKNVKIENKNQRLDLGEVYLPSRGQWVEGYRKIKKGKDRSTIQKERKAWKKEGLPNCSGFVNDFLAPYERKQNALIEYPPSGSKKCFLIKNDTLIIDFEEFIKKY